MTPLRSRLKPALRALALASVLAAAAACGDDSSDAGASDGQSEETQESGSFAEQPLEDILAAVRKDTAAAQSVHVKGTVADEGEEIALDMSIARSGDCTGSVQRGKAFLEVLAAEDRLFYRPDQAFYEMSGLSPEEAAQAVETVGDRWIEDKEDNFGEVCDLDELLEDDDDGPWGDFEGEGAQASVQGTGDVDGVEVVELVSEKDGESGSVFVAVDEPHYLMRVTGGDDDASGELSFSEWDEPVGAEVPAEAEIFVPPNS